MAPSTSHLITDEWLEYQKNNEQVNRDDDPNYWAATPEKLVTTSQPVKFSIGTGAEILSSVLAKCESTEHELIIVTCFWAKSSSLDAVSSLLRRLSEKALSQSRTIQIRLCFSSISLFQKLFQTTTLGGKIYPPSTWISLGLPSPDELRGLEMVVKSVFVRPFSVMHPKFILMDRKLAFMPSCNVSWEDWFEGCIEMQGDLTQKLFDFWETFWSRGDASLPPLPATTAETPHRIFTSTDSLLNQKSFPSTMSPPQTILLPSPHHINPKFTLILHPPPPPTPLNNFLLTAFTNAKDSLYIQSPNLTSAPVITSILSALQLGISVTIITSSKLMILEQLVTAGTITEIEIWKIRRRYQALLNMYKQTLIDNPDPEHQAPKPGVLKIGYYHPKAWDIEGEPVKSHLKLVIIDDEVVVLGSGNMDRASWYTSQELGVAFFSTDMARSIRNCVDEALIGRVDYVC